MKRSPAAILSAAIVAVVSLAVLGSGCGDTGVGQADDSKSLEGRTWRAVEIAGVAEVQTSKNGAATAKFSEGRVGGSGSVNIWGADYTTGPGNTIQIGQVTTTEMAGPEDLMAQEAAYYAALPKAATYQVSDTPGGASLALLDEAGAVLVKFEAVPPAPLTGTVWYATSYNNGTGGDESVSSDSVISAIFGADGSLTGRATINQYSTRYTATPDGSMTIDAQIASTKMGGPEELMAQEAAYLAALPKTATYSIEGDELELRDASGAVVARFVGEAE
jgi:heat shock protein HslJ